MATATLEAPEMTVTEVYYAPEVLTETPSHFIEWLTQKNPNDVIGHACISYACPVAKWLKEVYGDVCYADTGGCEIVDHDGYLQAFTTPVWMSKFIRAVDRLESDEAYPDVTAQQALDILASL